MKTIYKICIAAAAWGTICLIAIPPIVTSCSSDKDKIEDRVIDEGLLRNDDLVAVKTSDGKVTIKNATTGKVFPNFHHRDQGTISYILRTHELHPDGEVWPLL